ncbi:MAG TPA: sulfur carrier protein ThiS adenylyltransferase ThiF [Candidatus Mailhella merdavium]|nr:sulfur carrier protein ThiS adenylyltransferase ThiF [Candidatus Mailhella merdavium]
MACHLPPGHIARLDSVRVGIAGAGGLGSNCAMLLVRSGVRHLYIADHDVVSLSNLNRQFFFPDQLGQSKIAALAENLRALNPSLDLTLLPERLDESSAVTFFSSCDIVAEAVDDAETKQKLIHALLEAGHVVVAASGMAGWGNDMRRRILGRLTVVGDFTSEVNRNAPPLAPRVMLAAAMQADEILRRILDEEQ